MRIGQYKLENTFLTKANTVAMQWLDERERNLTIWTDKRGQVRNTSTAPVPQVLFLRALDYYMTNHERMLSHKLR